MEIIYKYNEETKKFILDYSLECNNNGVKVIELSNERLAFLADNIAIYFKENGKYIKNGDKFKHYYNRRLYSYK